MRLGRRRKGERTPGNGHPALHDVNQRGGHQRRHDHHNHPGVSEADEGQLEKVKANVDAEQRIGLAERDRVQGREIIEGVTAAPLAGRPGHQHHRQSDQPLEQVGEALKQRKLDQLAVHPVSMPARQAPRDQHVSAHHQQHSKRGQRAEIDASFEQRPVNDPEAFLAEPKPVDDQIEAAGKQAEQ